MHSICVNAIDFFFGGGGLGCFFGFGFLGFFYIRYKHFNFSEYGYKHSILSRNLINLFTYVIYISFYLILFAIECSI